MTVPDLSGLSVDEAIAIAARLELSLVTADGQPLTGPGLITSQQPAPGELLARHSAITVWIAGPGGDDAGVREPRTPPPATHPHRAEADEP
ncbi:MAG: PASTA domain-containing protein [Sciscionella sp.]|nr:PASTA domain-containing protein [Sciscionella sp.]